MLSFIKWFYCFSYDHKTEKFFRRNLWMKRRIFAIKCVNLWFFGLFVTRILLIKRSIINLGEMFFEFYAFWMGLWVTMKNSFSSTWEKSKIVMEFKSRKSWLVSCQHIIELIKQVIKKKITFLFNFPQ